MSLLADYEIVLNLPWSVCFSSFFFFVFLGSNRGTEYRKVQVAILAFFWGGGGVSVYVWKEDLVLRLLYLTS